MGISAAPEKYQPTPPRYIRAGENCEDEEDGQDEEKDLEAPYLAPKPALPSGPAQSEESAQIPVAGEQISVKDLSDSDLSEPMPELIELREEGERPSPSPSQKANHPTMLKIPIPILPYLKDRREMTRKQSLESARRRSHRNK